MDFDFSDIKAKIANMDRTFALAAEGNNLAYVYTYIFPRKLQMEIVTGLAPALARVTPQTSPDILQDMDFIYLKMIELAPAYSLPYIVKGNFHAKCENFVKAAECFQAAYNIIADPTRKTWPRMDETADNGQLLLSLGICLIHSGQQEDGERFAKAGQKMLAKCKPSEAPDKVSPPPEPS